MRSKNQTKPIKQLKSKLFQDLNSIPLCLVTIVPFILNIFVTVSLIEHSFSRQTQKKIDDLVKKSSSSINNRLSSHLDSYLQTVKNSSNELNEQILSQTAINILQQIDVQYPIKAMIVRKNGSIIASNNQQQGNMLSPTSQETLTYLQKRYNNFSDIKQIQQFNFGEQQQRIWGQITPWQDNELGLNWLVIVTFPESEFRINPTQEKNKLRLEYLAYLLPTTLLGVITYIWITRIINHLSKIALAITKDQHNFQVKDPPVTELKLLEQSLQQIANQLQASKQKSPETETERPVNVNSGNYEQNFLLADMSHELRSPLNAILGFAQIMEQESSMTRSQRENLAIINRSGKRLLSVINDVVDISKIESNRLILEHNSFDFHLWLDNIESNLEFQAHNQGLEFSLIRHRNLPKHICIDERRLRQILRNLIDYSLRYTQAAEVTLRVACLSSISGSISSGKQKPEEKFHIYFEVENTDFPIPPEELSTLFDPVVRASEKRKSPESSSLSLPISLQLAKLMGGDITVSSNNNLQQGITFRLDVQTEAMISQELQVQSTPRKVIGLESDQSEYRILIVDDSKTNRKIMTQLLEPVGFKVQEAVNGKEAVERWLHWHPHMIWMDIRMPVMNGYEATEQIKSYCQHPSTPIVAITAGTLEEERSLFQAAGCDDFVGKPFSESIIFDKITQHLGVRYIYESITPSTSSQFKLTPDALKIMPSQWLTKLEEAAAKLDQNLLTQLIHEIPAEHSGLHEALQNQVDNFDFDKILSLARQSKSSRQSKNK